MKLIVDGVEFKLGLPKIPIFNGRHFEQWKMYPDYVIVQVVRNSLQDEVRQILLILKPTASTVDIIEQLSMPLSMLRRY